MELGRLKRYKDKLNIIAKRSGEISEWKEQFLHQEKDKLACYKAMQEMVEAALDVVAMMVKDEKIIPKDDYTNLSLLKEKKSIGTEVLEMLAEANGLRNRIVHEYNGLDDRKAYHTLLRLLPSFDQFISRVESWLRTP